MNRYGPRRMPREPQGGVPDRRDPLGPGPVGLAGGGRAYPHRSAPGSVGQPVAGGPAGRLPGGRDPAGANGQLPAVVQYPSVVAVPSPMAYHQPWRPWSSRRRCPRSGIGRSSRARSATSRRPGSRRSPQRDSPAPDRPVATTSAKPSPVSRSTSQDSTNVLTLVYSYASPGGRRAGRAATRSYVDGAAPLAGRQPRLASNR